MGLTPFNPTTTPEPRSKPWRARDYNNLIGKDLFHLRWRAIYPLRHSFRPAPKRGSAEGQAYLSWMRHSASDIASLDR
jgi:hypothetical protein